MAVWAGSIDGRLYEGRRRCGPAAVVVELWSKANCESLWRPLPADGEDEMKGPGG